MIFDNFQRRARACSLAIATAAACAASAQTLLLDIDRELDPGMTTGRVTVGLVADAPLPGPALVVPGNSIYLRVPAGTSITGFSSPTPAGYNITGPITNPCVPAGFDYYLLIPTPSGRIIQAGQSVPAGQSIGLFSFDLPNPKCSADIELVDPATDPCVAGSQNAQPTATFLSRAQLAGAVGLLTTAGNDNASVPCDPNTPVPVELTRFTAVAVGETSALEWQTASELGNAGYEVQRNTLGSDWVTIGWVDGNGTKQSASDYAFVDEAPLNGVNYYRLRQVDFDGSEAYSGVASTRFDKRTAVAVYPNPSQGKFRVDFPQVLTGEVLFRVADVNGRLVHERKVVDPGFVSFDLELGHLPDGTYQLDVVSSLGEATERLVIINY